jgi:hypothetical protein
MAVGDVGWMRSGVIYGDQRKFHLCGLRAMRDRRPRTMAENGGQGGRNRRAV